MKLWIARDSYDFLGLYKDWKGEFIAFLPKSFFPEVTFENSPKEVELKLVK